jgi:hypothetical protein
MSLPNDLDQHPLAPEAVKTPGQSFRLARKDLLPRAEIKPAVRDGNSHLAAHHAQPVQLRSASGGRRRCSLVALGTGPAGAVVLVLAGGRVRRQGLQPDFIVMVQAALVVVGEHACSNGHGIYEDQSLFAMPLSSP